MTIFTPCTVDEISEAVCQKLLHHINLIRDDITRVEDNLRRNLTSLINEKVTSLRESVSEDLMDYKNQTVSDLHTSLQSNTQQLCAKMDTLYSKLISVNAQCTSVPLSSTTPHTSPTSLPPSPTSLPPSPTSLPPSPTSLPSSPTSLPPSPTSLQPSPTSLPPSPTSLQPSLISCGGLGWRRVVYLNFTDPNTTCPSGWQLTSHSKRTCGRVSYFSYSCDSVTFPVSGGDYTRVCGRIIGYQYDYTNAFFYYNIGLVTTIDAAYISGVSLTHGSPRQHIWTFAVGYGGMNVISPVHCPCETTINTTIPPFVGGDYFCETGRHGGNSFASRIFYPDNPLWDGQNCTATSTCCSFNNPPYFTKELPSPTTDDIEARICTPSANQDVPIEFMELYVQ